MLLRRNLPAIHDPPQAGRGCVPRRQGSLGCLLQTEAIIRHINQSELVTFLRCRRKWNYGYVKGLGSPGYSSNLETGSAVHAALQAHYKQGLPFDVLDEYWAPWLETEGELPPGLLKDVELSQIMVEGYLEWLEETGNDAYLTPVAVEQKVELLIRPDVTLHGTIDLVMQDEDGRYWLFDHKTTASFGALVDRRLQMNFQLMTYAVLTEAHFGQAPAGATLNMLRKVKRTASAKPPFYQRETVNFNSMQLAAYKNHLDAIVTDLFRVEELIALGDESAAYPIVDGDCSWKCPFLSVCALADDGSDIQSALNDLYVRRDRSH